MLKRVDVVILSLYRIQKTINCVESLFRNCDKDLFNIIIIDNGSDKETKAGLETIYLKYQLDIIFNNENVGTGAGRTQALQYCTGDYVLFLDNDIIVKKNYIEELIKVMEQGFNVGAVGSQVIKDGVIQLHGRYIKNRAIDYSADYCMLNDTRAAFVKEVDIIHGGSTLYPRHIFNKVSFDKNYTCGYEDLDLMMQIKEAGYKLMYSPIAVAHHFPDFAGEYGKIRRNLVETGKSRKYFQDKWRLKT